MSETEPCLQPEEEKASIPGCLACVQSAIRSLSPQPLAATHTTGMKGRAGGEGGGGGRREAEQAEQAEALPEPWLPSATLLLHQSTWAGLEDAQRVPAPAMPTASLPPSAAGAGHVWQQSTAWYSFWPPCRLAPGIPGAQSLPLLPPLPPGSLLFSHASPSSGEPPHPWGAPPHRALWDGGHSPAPGRTRCYSPAWWTWQPRLRARAVWQPVSP